MPIEHLKHGGTVFTGEAITYVRICTLKYAVALELKGIKVRRGRVVWRQVKAEFNLTGNKQAVYDWLCAKAQELALQQEHITEG